MPAKKPTQEGRSKLFTAIVASCASLLFALLVVNLVGGERKLEVQVHRSYGMDEVQYQRAMGVLLGPPIVGGNKFTALPNGDRIFPPMLSAIRGAQRSITFETYIYWSGDIGRQFADALSERARAGVPVHVLLDWVGSAKIDEAFLREMEGAGVEIRKFHKPAWYEITRMNNRTHRKLLVVDGMVGFTGGVGIAPEWTGHAQDADHWRDSHFQVEGPVVAQMQAVFMDNWIKASGEVLHSDVYFPAVQSAGSGRAQVFSSSPSGGSDSMHLMYLLSIAAATRTIDLSSAYFVPDALAIDALVAALHRGVRVRIIVPGPIIDAKTVRAASRASWGPLLQAGAQISEYQPTMFHCKLFVVDGLLVSVGSTNFDNRSFRLNDEANLNIYDADFASAMTEQFDIDLASSRQVTLQSWRDRPMMQKVSERLASLLSAQL